jgi:hypothetical protein
VIDGTTRGETEPFTNAANPGFISSFLAIFSVLGITLPCARTQTLVVNGVISLAITNLRFFCRQSPCNVKSTCLLPKLLVPSIGMSFIVVATVIYPASSVLCRSSAEKPNVRLFTFFFSLFTLTHFHLSPGITSSK